MKMNSIEPMFRASDSCEWFRRRKGESRVQTAKDIEIKSNLKHFRYNRTIDIWLSNGRSHKKARKDSQ